MSDAGQTNHSLSRRHRRTRGEGRQFRQPARCGRPGGTGRPLQPRWRRRTGLPRYHRLQRCARNHGGRGGAHRAQGVYPAGGGRRHPLGGGRAPHPDVGRGQGLGEHGGRAAAGADHRIEPRIRRAGGGAGHRRAAAVARASGTSTRAAAATTKASTPWHGRRAAKRWARARSCSPPWIPTACRTASIAR